MAMRHSLNIAITASLAGLLFGFDTAVISGVTQALREVFHLSPARLGEAVASALWGTLCGALFMGKPGDRFGTRDTLKLVGVLYIVSAVGSALAGSMQSFMVFRFIGGLGCWFSIRQHAAAARYQRSYGDVDIIVPKRSRSALAAYRGSSASSPSPVAAAKRRQRPSLPTATISGLSAVAKTW